MAAKAGARVVNVDACRLVASGPSPSIQRRIGGAPSSCRPGEYGRTIVNRITPERYEQERPAEALGRWPANVCLDEEAAAELDAQSGDHPGCRSPSSAKPESKYRPGQGNYQAQGPIYADSGGASRFFYCAKASRSEREAGLREAPRSTMGDGIGGLAVQSIASRNHHPTVKPVALMRWLVRLVTPTDGVALDPFMGSGTTGVACVHEGRSFIGIEREESYFDIAQARIRHAEQSPGLPLGSKKRSAKGCVDLQLLPGVATSTQSQKVG